MAGEEPDGKDEAMVPTDYPTAGLLTDNELNQTMLKSHKVRDAANLPAPTAFLPIIKQCPGSGPERLRNDHLHGLLPLCLHPRHPLCARRHTILDSEKLFSRLVTVQLLIEIRTCDHQGTLVIYISIYISTY